MTCNFCGSTLDDNEIECPYCGHKTGSAPAAKFEDEPEVKTAKSASNAFSEAKAKAASLLKAKDTTEKASQPQVKKSAPAVSAVKSSIPVPVFIGLIACALLCLITLLSVGSIKRSINELNQSMLSQIYQLQNADVALSAKIDELGSTVGTVSTTINEQSTSRNITITKEPSSASTYLGRGGADDDTQNVPVFTVEATGNNLAFTWQKYDDASKSWINLVWDADSNNETYGLHIYTDAAKGYSELAAHGIKSAGYGTYRCVVNDDYGNKATESVQITERDK